MNKIRILAAKTIILIVCMLGIPTASNAGVPVIDIANLAEAIVSVGEEIAQTAKQAEQYATQLDQLATEIQQYENMVLNTLSPVTNIWAQAQRTMNSYRRTVDTLTGYKDRFGNIENYLSKYKDINTYSRSACFNGGNCTNADRATYRSSIRLGSEAQLAANNAALEGLDSQQDALEADAETLEQLQTAAQGADGQVRAIGYTNQLSASQANQLLQMRGLMIAQQNAEITRNQALANKEAQQQAATDRAHTVSYAYGPHDGWTIIPGGR